MVCCPHSTGLTPPRARRLHSLWLHISCGRSLSPAALGFPRSALGCRTKSCASVFLGVGLCLGGAQGRVGSAACSCRRHIHPLFAPNLAAPRERTHTLQPLSDVASHTLHIQTLRKPRQPAAHTASATLSRAPSSTSTLPARASDARSSPRQRLSQISTGCALTGPLEALLRRGCQLGPRQYS